MNIEHIRGQVVEGQVTNSIHFNNDCHFAIATLLQVCASTVFLWNGLGLLHGRNVSFDW